MMVKMAKISSYSYQLIFLFMFSLNTVKGEIGILYARSGVDNSVEATICIAYNSLFHPLPSNYADMKPHLLFNSTSYNGCIDNYNTQDIKTKIISVMRGNCTFVEKAQNVQQHNASGIIVVNNVTDLSLTVPGGATQDYKNTNIVVATMLWKDYQQINALGENVFISMYSPVPARVDPNMACIFLIAVFCVGVGSYWSGIVKYQIKHGLKSGQTQESEEEESVEFSPIAIIILVILLCGMLVSLYFFYDYLVYVIIGLFTLAGTIGLMYCLQPFWNKCVTFNTRIPVKKIPCFTQPPEIRNVVLFCMCLSFGIFWAVKRHASYAWILQDILGGAFCINMLKTLRLPSLKVCTILLVLLFFYDIFFVFITPLFTKTGKSIMVDVATGGNSTTGEQLPMVFKFPRLLSTPLSSCMGQQYSLLGFGDVIVPGLLLAYNHGFDIEVGASKIYYMSTLIAYAVGLGFTFLALAFMETGQPALLYLVPCTLLTTFVIGCKRREVKRLWSGIKCSKKDDDIDNNTDKTGSINRSDSTSSITSAEDRVLIRS